jgi:hypothetical protein
MPFWPLTLTKRLVKGSKLTPAEVDLNWTDIEGAVNADHTNFSVALNADGTLKNNSVSTAALQDRSVTQRKLDFLSGFYAVDSGVANALVVTFVPALAAYAAGLIFDVKAVAGNTGATTLKGDPLLAPVAVQKYGPSGLVNLAAGDIVAGGVYTVVHDGTNFILLNPTPPLPGNSVQYVTPQLVKTWAVADVGWPLTPINLATWIPVASNPRFAILYCKGQAAQGGAGTACQFQTNFRSDPLGIGVFPGLLLEGGNIGGTTVSFIATGVFWVPVKIVGGAVNIEAQLIQTVIGNADTVGETVTLIGYST